MSIDNLLELFISLITKFRYLLGDPFIAYKSNKVNKIIACYNGSCAKPLSALTLNQFLLFMGGNRI